MLAFVLDVGVDVAVSEADVGDVGSLVTDVGVLGDDLSFARESYLACTASHHHVSDDVGAACWRRVGGEVGVGDVLAQALVMGSAGWSELHLLAMRVGAAVADVGAVDELGQVGVGVGIGAVAVGDDVGDEIGAGVSDWTCFQFSTQRCNNCVGAVGPAVCAPV